jgi:hypothetical protein
MMPYAAIRERYLRDEPRIRLGGLASNLARIQSFSGYADNKDEVVRLVEESAFFVEWTAVDLPDDEKVLLADLQRLLVAWQRSWHVIWEDQSRRDQVAREAGLWSQRILRLAGLISD